MQSCIFIIKRKPAVVIERLLRFEIGDVGISSITPAEFRFGAAKSKHRERNTQALDEFTIPLEVGPFDENAARACGDVRHDLEKAGTSLGAMHMLTAAHAVSLGTVLVTDNTRESGRISRLEVVDWTA